MIFFFFSFSFFFFIGMCWFVYLVVLHFRWRVGGGCSVVWSLLCFAREERRESKGETRINLCTACALLGCFAPGVYFIRHHVLPPP